MMPASRPPRRQLAVGTARDARPATPPFGHYRDRRAPVILASVDNLAHVAPVDVRLAAHLDALEYQRSAEVRERLAAALEIEYEAEAAGITPLAMRARLVRADMLHRAGQPTVGASLATEVNAWARRTGETSILARSHLVLSSLHEGIGDAASALEHALKALELVDESTPARTRANFILRLADAFAFDGSIASARERYREAERAFAQIGDPERAITALNNLAYAECIGGDAGRAWQCAQEMQALAERSGIELDAEFADTIGRALLGIGRLDEAAQVLADALALLERRGDVQAVTPAEVLLTLAEVQRHRGLLADAQASLDRCVRICRERGLASIETSALAEQAELQASAGRHDLAFETHKRFHAQSASLASARREAAVQTRQVMFETVEARRAAEQYWRQARTDPLSGLPNRRFLDEELARRLGEVAGGEQLVVAIADADHFKRINDTLSHAVGDRAISSLARTLQASLAPTAPVSQAAPALVGRLGGEEFLALLPVGAHEPAAAVLERIRADVEGHDWSEVADGLRLTVSIGATTARPEDAPQDVLRRADAQLYIAKRGGRNQIAFDVAAPEGGAGGSDRPQRGRRRPDGRPRPVAGGVVSAPAAS